MKILFLFSLLFIASCITNDENNDENNDYLKGSYQLVGSLDFTTNKVIPFDTTYEDLYQFENGKYYLWGNWGYRDTGSYDNDSIYTTVLVMDYPEPYVTISRGHENKNDTLFITSDRGCRVYVPYTGTIPKEYWNNEPWSLDNTEEPWKE